jgi:acetyltransferase-like isoleucine patch superfamily enzyme
MISTVEQLRKATPHWLTIIKVAIYEPVIVLRPENVWIEEGARIDSFVKLEGGLGMTIGKGVHIASFSHIGIGGGEVVIGDYAGLAGGCKILSGSNTEGGYAMSAAAPAEMQAVVRSKTVIGPRAFVGVNAVVMYGVTIGEGAIIGAGAVVTKDVPAWEKWAGVPARKIGERKHVEAPEMVL